MAACCRRDWLVFEVAAAPRDPFTLDRAAERWVEQTMKKLTRDEKIGQLIVPSFESNFLSTDSDTFEMLTRLVRDYHVGGFHVFGASQPAPSVLLNPGYGTVILGQPFSAAFLINRLQALSAVPLLNTADFETGVGFRIFGATAVSAADGDGRDPPARRARPAPRARGSADHRGRVARARRPREFRAGRGREQQRAQSGHQHPRRTARIRRASATLVGAYVAGARDGGMIATIKHFPGHGDTDVDSHLGLPVITFDRARLARASSSLPFRRGIEQGAEAVMAAHIELPALDPAPSTPATFSTADPPRSAAARRWGSAAWSTPTRCRWTPWPRWSRPSEAAVRAFAAGADQVLHSPDPIAAFTRHQGGARERARHAGADRRSRSSGCCARRRRSACTCSARSISMPCRSRSAAARIRRSRRRRSRARSRWSRTIARRCR